MTTVQVTSLYHVARAVGSSRIVCGAGIDHPLGDPTLPPDRERELRRRIVDAALAALATPVDGPTLFPVAGLTRAS